jgi:hypothetical protein
MDMSAFRLACELIADAFDVNNVPSLEGTIALAFMSRAAVEMKFSKNPQMAHAIIERTLAELMPFPPAHANDGQQN